MPELAEVEFFRRRWDPGLGRTVVAIEVHARARVFRGTNVPALTKHLTRAALLGSWTHGKQMMFRFSRGGWLGVHLGMTGELRAERGRITAGRHDHLVLHQDRRSLVFADPRQFGKVMFSQGPNPPAWWAALPPEVMSPAFTEDRVAAFLARRKGSPIKAVLLMQDCFPGIGNWMADEILWRAHLHPATKAGRTVRMAELLWSEVRWVAAGALRVVAKDYADPPASWLFRHRWKDGGRCPRDGTILQRATVGGRTTAWCGSCQRKA